MSVDPKNLSTNGELPTARPDKSGPEKDSSHRTAFEQGVLDVQRGEKTITDNDGYTAGRAYAKEMGLGGG